MTRQFPSQHNHLDRCPSSPTVYASIGHETERMGWPNTNSITNPSLSHRANAIPCRVDSPDDARHEVKPEHGFTSTSHRPRISISPQSLTSLAISVTKDYDMQTQIQSQILRLRETIESHLLAVSGVSSLDGGETKSSLLIVS